MEQILFYRWLDPSKLVRKQVRRSTSHSSANTAANTTATQGQNGHGQKSNSNNLGGGGNVIILYFRVKFYVTGKTSKTNKHVNNAMSNHVYMNESIYIAIRRIEEKIGCLREQNLFNKGKAI